MVVLDDLDCVHNLVRTAHSTPLLQPCRRCFVVLRRLPQAVGWCGRSVCLGFAVMAAYLVYSVITVRKFYERNSERERLEAEKLK
eukprot:COSAG01_NODE_1896_length_8969_cov_35.725028_2_plen_85_part_00